MATGHNTSEFEVEPYKLSEIFSIIPEYEGDQIFLSTFLHACECAYNMSNTEQKNLLVIHIKNKLRGRAAQLISSRNPVSFLEIKQLLNLHFGDSRDLSALIQDLQRLKQIPNESALTFYNRVQVLNAKMHSCIQKSYQLSSEQRQAQIQLIETMALNTLLTGLEPRLGQIIRASQPRDLPEAQSRIRREIQLSYFENQKFNKPMANIQRNPQNNTIRKPQSPILKCFSCGRNGHISNQCRFQQQTQSGPSNFQNNPSNFQRTTNFQPQIRSNPNFQRPPFQQQQFQPRPTVMRENPNFKSTPHRTHYVGFDDDQGYCYTNDNDEYNDFNNDFFEQYPEYSNNQSIDYQEHPIQGIESPRLDTYQDFPPVQHKEHPPESQNNREQPIEQTINRIQAMNLLDMNPNSNIPDQAFL